MYGKRVAIYLVRRILGILFGRLRYHKSRIFSTGCDHVRYACSDYDVQQQCYILFFTVYGSHVCDVHAMLWSCAVRVMWLMYGMHAVFFSGYGSHVYTVHAVIVCGVGYACSD